MGATAGLLHAGIRRARHRPAAHLAVLLCVALADLRVTRRRTLAATLREGEGR